MPPKKPAPKPTTQPTKTLAENFAALENEEAKNRIELQKQITQKIERLALIAKGKAAIELADEKVRGVEKQYKLLLQNLTNASSNQQTAKFKTPRTFTKTFTGRLRLVERLDEQKKVFVSAMEIDPDNRIKKIIGTIAFDEKINNALLAADRIVAKRSSVVTVSDTLTRANEHLAAEIPKLISNIKTITQPIDDYFTAITVLSSALDAANLLADQAARDTRVNAISNLAAQIGTATDSLTDIIKTARGLNTPPDKASDEPKPPLVVPQQQPATTPPRRKPILKPSSTTPLAPQPLGAAKKTNQNNNAGEAQKKATERLAAIAKKSRGAKNEREAKEAANRHARAVVTLNIKEKESRNAIMATEKKGRDAIYKGFLIAKITSLITDTEAAVDALPAVASTAKPKTSTRSKSGSQQTGNDLPNRLVKVKQEFETAKTNPKTSIDTFKTIETTLDSILEDAKNAKESEDRKAKEDADRRAKEEADRRTKEEADRNAKTALEAEFASAAQTLAKEEMDARAAIYNKQLLDLHKIYSEKLLAEYNTEAAAAKPHVTAAKKLHAQSAQNSLPITELRSGKSYYDDYANPIQKTAIAKAAAQHLEDEYGGDKEASYKVRAKKNEDDEIESAYDEEKGISTFSLETVFSSDGTVIAERTVTRTTTPREDNDGHLVFWRVSKPVSWELECDSIARQSIAMRLAEHEALEAEIQSLQSQQPHDQTQSDRFNALIELNKASAPKGIFIEVRHSRGEKTERELNSLCSMDDLPGVYSFSEKFEAADDELIAIKAHLKYFDKVTFNGVEFFRNEPHQPAYTPALFGPSRQIYKATFVPSAPGAHL